MKIVFGPEILEAYKRLSYKPWYALAEFVDNSTQSYLNNRELLDKVYQDEGRRLEVKIDANNDRVIVWDNSIGMSSQELDRAMTIGLPPEIKNGRSKYGLGLKTAAFWFGNVWTIETTKLGESNKIFAELDLVKIVETIRHANSEEDQAVRESILESSVKVKEGVASPEEHYTRIEISALNKNFTTQLHKNVKEHLRSIYRYDISGGNLILQYNNEILAWSKDEFTSRLRKDSSGIPYYKEIEFEVNKKRVKGWAGVLSKGRRKDAGFSLIQNNRVIRGWPNGYKPPTLFGDIEGGQNTLTNQRLVGELFLDEFPVSHTKDEILFTGLEEDELDGRLAEFLADFRRVAESAAVGEELDSPIDFEPIVNGLFEQMQNTTFRAYVNEYPVKEYEEIQQANSIVLARVLEEPAIDNFSAQIGDLKVNVIINHESSPYDPYLILDYQNSPNEVFVVINKKHPIWDDLTDYTIIAQFLRDCIFDGIAEWKAFRTNQVLQPDTIKSIKDLYMRFKLTYI